MSLAARLQYCLVIVRLLLSRKGGGTKEKPEDHSSDKDGYVGKTACLNRLISSTHPEVKVDFYDRTSTNHIDLVIPGANLFFPVRRNPKPRKVDGKKFVPSRRQKPAVAHFCLPLVSGSAPHKIHLRPFTDI